MSNARQSAIPLQMWHAVLGSHTSFFKLVTSSRLCTVIEAAESSPSHVLWQISNNLCYWGMCCKQPAQHLISFMKFQTSEKRMKSSCQQRRHKIRSLEQLVVKVGKGQNLEEETVPIPHGNSSSQWMLFSHKTMGAQFVLVQITVGAAYFVKMCIYVFFSYLSDLSVCPIY